MDYVNSPPVNIELLARRLKVISEPKRLLILHTLMEGMQCNCVLGDVLKMAPNLISHHLSVLREAGLVDAERDSVDGRWIYYSVNLEALQELTQAFGLFFDLRRIKPRRQICGPKNVPLHVEKMVSIRTELAD